MKPGYLPQLQVAPQQLINTDGQPHSGLFDASVPELNWPALDYRTVLDRPASRLARHFQFKQFQFITIASADWLLAVAIADIRYASSGFAYLYQRGQATFEKGLLLPLQFGCKMSASANKGRAQLQQGRIRWQIDANASSWQLQLDCGPLQADLILHKARQRPLSLCAATGYAGLTYTEKNNALAVSGQLSLADKTFDVTQALAGYDFSAGYMRRETSWRWASINQQLAGQPFGLNLAAGVNETGLCENALWYQGQIQHLSPAQFTFSRTDEQSIWHISTLCGELALTFVPLYCRKERVQTGILASNFRQYVGRYSGQINLLNGQQLLLNDCLGLAEDHYAKW